MSKKLLVLVAGILLIAPLFISKATAATPLTGHKIILDAGHGGTDSGSTACDGLNESDANLDIAERLKSRLEGDGATVYMTRTEDVYKDNATRYDYANSTDGEVLVSIHLNGSTDPEYNGSMNLYTKPWKDKEFTSVIDSGMAEYLNVPDLGTTNFMSGVTLKFTGPAVTVEPVFISNTNECSALKAGSRQDDIVDVLYDGLTDWFSVSHEITKPGNKK